MGNDNKKGKQRGKKFVWFERMLRREGRKLCAVALCASMIIGNMAWPAAAASDTSGEYSFELTSESLFNAIQDAIAEGTVVDTDLELKGSAAEEYQSFLEAGSSLYEIEPVIDNDDSDRDKVLDLRAFVRLENDIELDSAYVMDGSEEITFLLVNSSDVYQQATISVDGRESETITVLPASAVAVDEEEAGPGVSGTANNSNTTVTGSGSGSGGSGGGGGNNDVDTSTTDGDTTITETDANPVEITIENEDADSDDESDEDSIVDVQVSDSQDTEEEESKADAESETGADDAPVTDDSSKETGYEDDETEVTDSTSEEEPGEESSQEEEPEDDGTTEGSGTVGEAAEADTTGEEGETGTEGSGIDESGNGESGGNQDEGTNDNTEDDEQDDTEDYDDVDVTVVSAISVHNTYRVAAAATASDADADEATPSDASELNGQTYEAILLSGDAAVAFVAEAEELGLDKIESITYTAELDDVMFSVDVPVGALPWGVELKAREYGKDSETYLSRYAETVELIDDLDEEEDYTEAIRLFNVGFYDADGVEVEPTEKVSVTITYLDADAEEVGQVVHFGEETEVVDIETEYDEDGNQNITFELESFSDIVVASVGDNTSGNYSGHIDVRLYTSSFTFTQEITEDSTQKITVNKVWSDGESNHTSETITVYLTNENGEKVIDENGNYYSLELNASNGWSGYWEGLTLPAGNYSVEEEEITGYSFDATSVTVGEAGSVTEKVTVTGSLELTGISSTLTYTHNGNTYTTTGYSDRTDSSSGSTEKEYHFQNNAYAEGSKKGTGIVLSNGDEITITVSFKATYTVTDSAGNVIASATNKEFTDYEYTETVSYANNKCADWGYDFYVYPADLLESIINEEAKTITVTNTPSESTDSDNYIIVEKTFVGLTEDQIPNDFQVTVGEYVLTKDNDNWSQSTDDDGNIVWRWQVNGAEADTYTVSESNADVENYTLSSEGASGSVTVTAANFEVEYTRYEKCETLDWPVNISEDTSTFFAATLTSGQIVVITATPLSASQKLTIENAVHAIKGPWSGDVYFYDLETNGGNSFVVEGGATITYNEETKEIHIGATSYWKQLAILSYSITEADNPEIAITNTYTPNNASVTVTKTVSGSMGDKNEEFSFTVSVDGYESGYLDGTYYIDNETGAYADNDNTEGDSKTVNSGEFTLSDGESITFSVPIGASFTVTETDNGSGYTTTINNGEAGVLTKTIPVTAAGAVIEVINNREIKSPTGIFTEYLPYALMVIAALLGGVWLVNDRRKKIYANREQ